MMHMDEADLFVMIDVCCVGTIFVNLDLKILVEEPRGCEHIYEKLFFDTTPQKRV